MRIVSENIRQGSKQLIPESITDLFLLHNLIDSGDLVTARTDRRVRKSGVSGREGDKGERVKMTLTIAVEEVNFQDSEVDHRLRIRGRIQEGPSELVSLGSMHTINIEKGETLTIVKPEWSKYHYKILEEGKRAVDRPAIGLIAMERGIATIGMIDNFKMEVVAKESTELPGKIAKTKQRDSAEKNFYNRILSIIRNQLNGRVEVLVIGGPSHTKDYFHKYLLENWPNNEKKIFIENISTGTVAGLHELINREIIDRLATEYNIIRETKYIEEFESRIAIDPSRIGYGLDQIVQLLEQGAIEVLLISDMLVRSRDVTIKPIINHIMDLIDQTRVNFLIIDHKSENGKKIETFGKAIALLRYAIYREDQF